VSDTRDAIPRSTMTTDQQRRIGALQSAKAIIGRTAYNAPELTPRDVASLLEIARYIETGQ
jgi:hypothetical protein